MDAASSAPNPLIFLACGLCFLALLIAWLADEAHYRAHRVLFCLALAAMSLQVVVIALLILTLTTR